MMTLVVSQREQIIYRGEKYAYRKTKFMKRDVETPNQHQLAQSLQQPSTATSQQQQQQTANKKKIKIK